MSTDQDTRLDNTVPTVENVVISEPFEEEVLTPWAVKGTVNYMKQIEKFGTSGVDGKVIERFERVTGKKAHHFLRRGLVFSHQDVDKVLDEYEAGRPVYIYTGRGPSSESMHLGHMVPFVLTKFLQDALDAVVVIQMSDDEKFYFKGETSDELDEFNRLTYENAKDIIACGFNLDKTLIFSNLEAFGGALYRNCAKLMRATTGNQVKGTYGLDLNNNIGALVWPCMQCAPAYSTSFNDIFGNTPRYCLVPMAIDQAPYFRMARDLAKQLGCPKPAVIHSQFLPGLKVSTGKMSSTVGNGAGSGEDATLFLDRDPADVARVIKKHAFSGGKQTLEDHRKYGGDIKTDVCYQYQLYFNPSDEEVRQIAEDYTSGKLLSGDLKKMTAELVSNVIRVHQERKAKVTKETVDLFFKRDRKFDLSVTKKTDDIGSIYTDYSNYGLNFDLMFGYKCQDLPQVVTKVD